MTTMLGLTRTLRFVVAAGVLATGVLGAAQTAHAQVGTGSGMQPLPAVPATVPPPPSSAPPTTPAAAGNPAALPPLTAGADLLPAATQPPLSASVSVSGLLPTTEALPPTHTRKRKWKLFDLDGYFRLRTDWFKNFNLGFIDNPQLGGAPFPRAAGCTIATVGSEGELGRPCNGSLASTNMRLRLEPTFNLDEHTSVHVQADVLDNLVLGSTPVGQQYNGIYNNTTNRPPVGAFTDTQQPPVAGLTSDRDSITLKRAWGEIALPIGIVKFGRQPDQWGMGIHANAGGYDPLTGLTDYDADYGDSVDRVSFSTLIPGTKLRAMVGFDWPFTSLTTSQTSQNQTYASTPFDLDNSANANQYVGVLSRIDTPDEFKATVDRGKVALNYGVYFTYRRQKWAENLVDFTIGDTFNAGGACGQAPCYVPRGLNMYTPDFWFKGGYKRWSLEAEFVAQLGKIDRLDDADGRIDSSANIRKYGGAARGILSLVDNKLHIGTEVGFASGDQWDNTVQGQTNIAFENQLGGAGDTTLSAFNFNQAYHVDLIMWRYLFTAVTNAVYVKPYIKFDIIKQISAQVSNVTSFAAKPVSTPGNGVFYGTEFDADIGYTDSRLFLGISGGVLFPFGAMSHPVDNVLNGGPGFGYGTDSEGNVNTGDGGTAYTVQSRLVLKF